MPQWLATQCEVMCTCTSTTPRCPVISILHRLVSNDPDVVVSLGADVHGAYGIAMHVYENGPPRLGGATDVSVLLSSANMKPGAMDRPADHGTALVGCILAGGAGGLAPTRPMTPPISLVPLHEARKAPGGLVPHTLSLSPSASGPFIHWSPSNQGPIIGTSIPVLEGCVGREVQAPSVVNGVTPNELFQMLRMAHAAKKELLVGAVPTTTTPLLPGHKRLREDDPQPTSAILCRFKVQKDGVLNIV
jgi:hypothetical protein